MLVLYLISSVVFLLIFGIISLRNKEGFYHRAVLKGTTDRSRSNYTLEELDYRNPQGYYDDKSMSVYDKSLLHQHSKRFDPKMTN